MPDHTTVPFTLLLLGAVCRGVRVPSGVDDVNSSEHAERL